MTRIRHVDNQGRCIDCKSKDLGNHDPCWKEATRKELNDAWVKVSGK